jgi:leucyl aminopeptidase
LLPGALPGALPPGDYRYASKLPDPELATLAWLAGSYRFGRYKTENNGKPKRLALPDGVERARVQALAEALYFGRDLINIPANDLGPAELEAAAREIGTEHGASVKVTEGSSLLSDNFPMIHAVGRASDRPPRLIDLRWGSERAPKVTIVGKGICFDTGGLDIKPGSAMALMKKDMGGAAAALTFAHLVMQSKLPLRLRVLIPAADNAIAGNAFRPGDVFKTRQGLHIEIGNTDAEGRVILCDALAYGAEGKPELMIDLATLTGAARVALGSQLPALFTRDTALARQLVDGGLALHDPLWHLPLWRDYHGGIESDIADIVNTGKGALAGAINAAIFLEDFVPADQAWLHIDLFAWNDSARPGRPVGGEAQTLRTLLSYLESRFHP